MLLLVRRNCTKILPEVYPYSAVKVFRNSNAIQTNRQVKNTKDTINISQNTTLRKKIVRKDANPQVHQKVSAEYRENQIKIQMISKNLFEQLFGSCKSKQTDLNVVAKCINELQRHGINIKGSGKMEDVVLKIPPLHGGNIEEHFRSIGRAQSEPYEFLTLNLISNKLPTKPVQWNFQAGWTRYNSVTGEQTAVKYPDENALVLDVEVCMSAGKAPTMAVAVGCSYWYSWVSPQLIDLTLLPDNDTVQRYSLDDLITLGKDGPKLIVGHNVSYDRARIREQYLIEDTGARFLDTMSLHVCVSGVTSYQRAMLKSKKDLPYEDQEWSSETSLNSLAEIYKLYCSGDELRKESRATFIEGNLQDIRNDFQNLMTYCSNDVTATSQILRKLFPLFRKRFPHPVTLAGMFEIGSAYLPVNGNWSRYINESNLTYEDLDIEAKYHLSKRAEESCSLLIDEKYKSDLWMWDEDWGLQDIKMKKQKIKKIKAVTSKRDLTEEENKIPQTYELESDKLARKFQYLYDTKHLLPVRRPLLPGYPAWYRKVCARPPRKDVMDYGDCNWSAGAAQIGTGMQIAPKLLSLCWEGYPLHYLKEHGWGFLIPFRATRPEEMYSTGKLPIEQLVKHCPVLDIETGASEAESIEAMHSLWKDVESNLSKKNYYSKIKADKTQGRYKGTGVWCNQILDECCWFLKLPHKNGSSYRVGNPLAKDFLNKFSENVLTSGDVCDKSAERVIEIARMLSYWRNNRDRIMGQMVVWLSKNDLPEYLKDDNQEYGAICPQVVVCGTLTRRAMEPTWMTASNAQRERVGSELRSMIQAPRGYKIVGADVDSQELWIASVLGDAHATRMHGATPFGWMTLSGSKSKGTDMHSVTAKAVGISRDHAKVINYARIYGAGQNFAERLLKQFNPTLSDSEAKAKAMKMFALTKGKKTYYLREEFINEHQRRGYSGYEALKIASSENHSVPEMFHKVRWQGGTESAMFNRLEEISSSGQPVTPFLGCRLSRALEPKQGTEDRFLPTRVNWVVQSGAVDFLHLMLVSMRWLMGNNIRFCLSFHDELRYLARDDVAYKAALAMHLTNLLTRSYCVTRIGLTDLPMAVAFFSAVEVDTVLRKESSMDCKTPSNPHGLQIGYGISPGESLNIYETIRKAKGADITQWEWHKSKQSHSK